MIIVSFVMILSCVFSKVSAYHFNFSSYYLLCWHRKNVYIVVTCQALSLDNGAVSYNKNLVGNRYPVDTVASFSCNSGYDRDGCASTACLMSGQWAHQKPTCNKGDKYHIVLYFELVIFKNRDNIILKIKQI